MNGKFNTKSEDMTQGGYSSGNRYSQEEPASSKKPLVIGGVILLVVIIAGVYFFTKGKSTAPTAAGTTAGQTAQQSAQAAAEVASVLQQVGKLVPLPTNEEPTIATVVDPNKLKDQAFFAKAAVGDKVLLYPKNARAILFRPSSNQILEIAPFSTDINPGQVAGQSTTR